MKRKFIAFGLVCSLVLGGCGSGKDDTEESRKTVSAQSVQNEEGSSLDSEESVSESRTAPEQEESTKDQEKGTYTIIEGQLMMKIPSDWIYCSEDSGYYKDGRVQFMMWTYDDYDKKRLKELKEAFGYQDEKEALREYVQLGVDVSPNRIEKYTEKQLCLPGYRLYLTGEKWYPGERKVAAFKAQAMIDRKEKKLYMLYFFDEMADEERVDAFLEGITLFDEKDFYDETDGLFRWQGGAEKYPK